MADDRQNTVEQAKQRSAPRRPRGRIAFALAWLRRPDEVGQPLTLRPRGVRLLALLILGNLAVLVLLTVALYQAVTLPAIEEPAAFAPVATATPAPFPTPGTTPTPLALGGAIAFTLRRNGNSDIYALNQADRQLVRLTYDPAEDRDPAWSPDGNYIAFASNRAHNWDIYLLDLASGALIRLTHDPGFDANPSWSPDGEYVAFESYRHGNLDIYVMSTTGGQEVRRITTGSAPDYGPAWSPDSRAIAFTSFQDGNKDIYLYLFGEGKTLNVTHSPDLDEDDPAWASLARRMREATSASQSTTMRVQPPICPQLSRVRCQPPLDGAGLTDTLPQSSNPKTATLCVSALET